MGLTASGEENLAGSDFLFPGVFEKLPAELSGEQNRPDFPFQGDFGAAQAGRFHCKVFHFTDPDAGRTDRFEEEGEAVFAEAFGGRDQAVEFIAGQLAGVVPEGAALEFQGTGAAVGPAGEGEKGVQGGEFAVDGAGTKTFSQGLLPLVDGFRGHFPAPQPGIECADIVHVFFDGGGGALLFQQFGLEAFQDGGGESAFFHGNSSHAFSLIVPGNDGNIHEKTGKRISPFRFFTLCRRISRSRRRSLSSQGSSPSRSCRLTACLRRSQSRGGRSYRRTVRR